MDAIAVEMATGWRLPGRRLAGAAMAALALAAPLAGLGSARPVQVPLQQVIVRAVPGANASVERAVKQLGGSIERRLGIINGFSAKVPANHVAWLAHNAQVSEVTPDASGHLLSDGSSGS